MTAYSGTGSDEDALGASKITVTDIHELPTIHRAMDGQQAGTPLSSQTGRHADDGDGLYLKLIAAKEAVSWAG